MINPDLLQDIEVVAEEPDDMEPPFIRVRRLRLRHIYDGDQHSATYTFDMIERPFADAVVIVIYHIDEEGKV